VLQPSLLSAGPRGLFQPRLDFHAGRCDFQCHVCSQVCPSGALLPLSLKEKQETRIGAAELALERCVVLTNGTACGACAEICPTGSAQMVPYRGELTIPALRDETCIGCGSCEFVCPAAPVRAITVRPAAEHRRISLAGATRVQHAEPEKPEEGFAF
jgi:formate hydrogenlyase subunit 6/NADH:ubiquinone oxidoreductase subunit I